MNKLNSEKGSFFVMILMLVLLVPLIGGSIVLWLRSASRQTVNTKADIRRYYNLESARDAALYELKRPDNPALAYKWTGSGTTTYYTIIDGNRLEVKVEDKESLN